MESKLGVSSSKGKMGTRKKQIPGPVPRRQAGSPSPFLPGVPSSAEVFSEPGEGPDLQALGLLLSTGHKASQLGEVSGLG